jgi:DHA1 family multidrug resistance protein-like MFS transporter
MGGYNTCIYLGMMLSSLTMGEVIHRFGFADGFYLTGLVSVVIIGAFHALMRGRLAPAKGATGRSI